MLHWWIRASLLACGGAVDGDEDGFPRDVDCDDREGSVFPGAPEVPYDHVDQDCVDGDLVDQDEDGFVAREVGGVDCDDRDPGVHPGVVEIWYDGVDGDCDGWSDDDADRDGFDAGEDCDDADPDLVPFDVDGDGFDPCTGDCDESDPDRNVGVVPQCGNETDDDCDGVSDCATVGIAAVEALPRVDATTALVWFGRTVDVVGDVDGDGAPELVVTGQRANGTHSVFVLGAPFAPEASQFDAWLDLAVGEEPRVGSAGDVDGDGRADLWVGDPEDLDDDDRVHLLIGVGPDTTLGDAALVVAGSGGSRAGEAAVVVGGALAVGAPGASVVQLLPTSFRGPHALAELGTSLFAGATDALGQSLATGDLDGDGVADLLIGAPGVGLDAGPAWLYFVPDPPPTGGYLVEGLANAQFDCRAWSPSPLVPAAADLDGDGVEDTVVGAPLADGNVGAVAVFTEPIDGAVDAAPIVRLGLGDDTFGASLLAADLDQDGHDDLIVGAPALIPGGAVTKPGAVHVWYGPLAPSIEHTFTADLYLMGAYDTYRAHTGAALALGDLDLDGGVDLAIGAPDYEEGAVFLLAGGFSGLYGL